MLLRILVTAAALLAAAVEGASALHLLELRVPPFVPRGTRAQLACRWRLGADALYSVKWYKDGREFFRHVPRDAQPIRSFPLPGVHVEASAPDGSNVTLGPAQAETGGRYRCEVSGERPLFPTVSDHADMAVVVLPEEGPTLSGYRSRYRAGERVRASCVSGPARPAVRLSWYVNGEPAPPAAVAATTATVGHGLEVATLTLDFRVTEEHFKNNGLKVKCLATLATLYWRSNEESAVRARDPAHATLELRTLTTVARADDARDRRRASNTAQLISPGLYVIVIFVCSLINSYAYLVFDFCD